MAVFHKSTSRLLLAGAFALAAAGCGENFEIPADAQKTPSGIYSKMLRVGVGSVRPTARSTVTVHYRGWTMDGNQFENSYDGGAPAIFPLDQVIPGWTEGLQLMVAGEKRRFWIPGHLAYDTPDARPDAPKGMLIFDVELLKVQ